MKKSYRQKILCVLLIVSLLVISSCSSKESPLGTIYFDNGRSVEFYFMDDISSPYFTKPIVKGSFPIRYEDENYGDTRWIPYSDIKSIEVVDFSTRYRQSGQPYYRYELRIITKKTKSQVDTSNADLHDLKISLYDELTDRIIHQEVPFKIIDESIKKNIGLISSYKLNIKKIEFK